ncbi:aminotransferase [Martelella alba]|uniref:aspartate transaminase n=1 Tax=Martelella alba TaxID=2590451 RepID=A0A506U6H0_9HYPH|nr:aminotransferase [Martelella alba]TPW29098.1 aminotransferase [Martelella alba]
MSAKPLLNPLVETMDAPPIPAVRQALAAYDGRHGPVLDLCQAVPGYAPHADLLTALSETAGDAALAGYGDIQGEGVLRNALAADINALYGGNLAASELQITAGGNQAFFVMALSLARPGDEVILIGPHYFNHDMTLRMLGITVRVVDGDPAAGFLPDMAAIKAATNAKTRAIFIVTPNNPTGGIYPPALVDALLDHCIKAGIMLVVDETYRDFLPAGSNAPHDLFTRQEWRDHFVHIYSFSKAYCIPGHRVGAIAAGGRIMTEIAKVMDNLQICAPRPAQHALVGAMTRLKTWRDENRDEIDRRRLAFEQAIATAGHWQIISIGAYFAYLRHPFDRKHAMEVARDLASEHGILVLPGSCFGARQEGYIRAAFANADVEVIKTLTTRLPVKL